MTYTILKLDDCDKSFKVDNRQVLCYSGKLLRKVAPDAKILGMVKLDSRKPCDNDDVLVIGRKKLAVRKQSREIGYQTIGYVPVEDGYIEVKRNRSPFLAWVSCFALICCIFVGVIWFNPHFRFVALDSTENEMLYPLPPVDVNIEPAAELPGQKTEPEAVPSGGGSVTIDYKPTATLNLSTGEISMRYTNPANSSHEVVLEFFVEDGQGNEYLIATSGRIPAGASLGKMTLTADKSMFGGEGVYEAQYKVSYYNPKTGERAMLRSSLDSITLLVKANG